LLHRLFVCIAGVADQLQTNFASDLRQILRSVFLMNMSSAQEDIDIPEKTKESELFEFRASENDVIQESAGSNQSIYSAEEVNPELDNVFNSGTSARHSAGAAMQRNNTIDLAAVHDGRGSGSGDSSSNSAMEATPVRNHVARSRSLGDHEVATSSTQEEQQRQRQQQQEAQMQLQMQRQRNNSVGSNSPSSASSTSSSSEHNSPVSTRSGSRRRLQSSQVVLRVCLLLRLFRSLHV